MMKITDIKAYVLEAKLPKDKQFVWAQARVTSRVATLVEIFTDDGIIGLGEAFGFSPLAIKAVIEGRFKEILIGENPFDINRLWDKLYTATRMEGQKGIAVQALSAVDIALWDIKGKFYDTPVSNLLGGCYRDRVATYPTGLYRRVMVKDQTVALIEEARGYLDFGFKAMKLKVGFGLQDDLDTIHAIREAIGPEPRLMLDANCAYTAAEAVWLAQRIQDCDIYWFEEPMPPEDIQGHLEFKRKAGIMLAAGESEFTRYGCRELIAKRAVDIIQPDTCGAGGLSEMMRIIALATAWNVRCIPHVWGTGVGLAANLQLQAAMPHFPTSLFPEESLIEFDRSPNPLREELVEEEFNIEGTRLLIPERPGLGVTLNKAVVKKYLVE
ncbi:MAG: mandelate racemase/muconate lactonizing enzyme family protein [Desulfobacterales bacterium]|jgi:D-galactarolactone cycloisomerase